MDWVYSKLEQVRIMKQTKKAEIPYELPRLNAPEMQSRSESFYYEMRERRSARQFSDEAIPLSVLETAIRTAGTAPSGANLQPWRFVVVTDAALKTRIRTAAEAEEKAFYEERATDAWLEDLAPLGTHAEKPYLEDAPALVVVFRLAYGFDENGEKRKHYYTQESVGLAVGILLAALHRVGLATLTHTPSPMGFLSEILERPANEKPFLLIPVGYPAPEATVPAINRKPLDQILLYNQGEGVMSKAPKT
jgi:iodotyrosine deiodinase